jgi:hypothetical protein
MLLDLPLTMRITIQKPMRDVPFAMLCSAVKWQLPGLPVLTRLRETELARCPDTGTSSRGDQAWVLACDMPRHGYDWKEVLRL